jgi:NitT/TauT family transport system permease protein
MAFVTRFLRAAIWDRRSATLYRHAADAGPLAAFIVLIIIWEAMCATFAVPTYILPAPTAIVRAGASIGIDEWWTHLMATLQVVLIGYSISIALAVPLAVLLTISRFLARTIYPILVVIQSMPIVAIAPILVVILGTNILPRIVIACMIGFFPLVIGTATGLRATPDELIELSKSLRAGRIREFTQIRLLYAVPFIFAGLKVSVILSVIGTVVSEFVAADRGLGFLILFSTSHFKLPQAFAALAVLVTSSLALYHLVVAAERFFFPWSVPRNMRQ